MTVVGCQPEAPVTFTFTPQELTQALISVTSWVYRRAIMRPDGSNQLDIPLTPHRESNPRPSGLWRSALTNCATSSVPQINESIYSTEDV